MRLLLLLCTLGHVAGDLRVASHEEPGYHCHWPNAADSIQFEDLGPGNCRAQSGGKAKHWFAGRKSMVECQSACARNPKCFGFSRSMQGSNVLFWLQADIKGGGPVWGGSHCYVKKGQGTLKSLHCKYMVPSTFNYKGLENQKKNNYDQFLRSNIDNEHDNRNFNVENGEDALPFRTSNADVISSVKNMRGSPPQVNNTVDLRLTVKPGESMLVPLRWNNPHAAELEVNIWIFSSGKPVVVPVKKPTCSGEGYQDNIFRFKVPSDFGKLGAKIPGFQGCNADSKPMCTLQIYAHSVESRTYASGFPVIVSGHDESLTATSDKAIQPMTEDPHLDLTQLRDICLPGFDLSQDIKQATPRWARLVSDVYNHAYQNSDFSPYSGQQHESISKNLQASAINKMTNGNRGELGKSILPQDTYQRLAALRTLESSIYRNYESLANKLIKSFGNQMYDRNQAKAVTLTAQNSQQELAKCFRCAEVGSTFTKRLYTNTYIPSYQLPKHLIVSARTSIPAKYSGLITDSGLVQIYVAALTDLLPFFFVAKAYGITYMKAMPKTSLATMADVTKFLKHDAKGKYDTGLFAASTALKARAKANNCPTECLYCDPDSAECDSRSRCFRPLVQAPNALLGGYVTCVTGKCSGCKALFDNYRNLKFPSITPLAAEIAGVGAAPGGLGKADIPGYPDSDGSPRLGRAVQEGERVPNPVQMNPAEVKWPSYPKAPTPKPGTTPPPNRDTEPSKPAGRRRRRRRSRRRSDSQGSSHRRRRRSTF